jgi:hypothetical protein
MLLLTWLRRLVCSALPYIPRFFLPLTISRTSTPKLNTSDLTEKMPSMAYSGDMYPLRVGTTIDEFTTSVGKLNQNPELHLLSSDHPSRVRVGAIAAEDPRHTEVRDLRVHVTVEEDVAGLEVPVNDLEPRVLVQVQKPACNTQYDVKPLRPVQLRRSSFICSNT